MVQEHVVDLGGLAGTREVMAYQNGGLFPVLAISRDRLLVAILRGGAGHLGLAGHLDVIRSLDGGSSWSPPATVANSSFDDRNPALGFTRSGTLVLAYHRQGSYDEAGVYAPRTQGESRPVELMVTRSRDAGLTWEAPRQLGVDARRFGSAFGKIVCLSDDTLLLAVYDSLDVSSEAALAGAWSVGERRHCSSHILASIDDGLTWSERSIVAVGANETALAVLPSSEVLTALRDDDGAIHLTRSSDAAITWTRPVQLTARGQHPADLALLSSGDVLLTFGNRNPPYRIEGRLSRDGGETWDSRTLVFSGPLYGLDAARRATDLGYPSTVVDTSTGRAVTIYYYNPDLPAEQTPAPKTATERERHPHYLATGYRAVAILWDESELLARLAIP